LERLPKEALTSEDQQSLFERIRNKISSTADILEELRGLYKVNNFGDFALSLMWIAEKVENDPSRLDPTTDEEALVFASLQKSFGGSGSIASFPSSEEMPGSAGTETPLSGFGPPVESPAQEAGTISEQVRQPAEENPFAFFETQEAAPASSAEEVPSAGGGSPFDIFAAPSTESVPESVVQPPEGEPADLAAFSAPPSSEVPRIPEPIAPAEPASGGPVEFGQGGDEQEHAALFEKFIEGLQSGAENRMTLFDQLVQKCQIVAAGGGPDDYKEYSQFLADLLKYLNDNQMLDDIRAMNMLSTAFDPFSQWVKADPSGREGLLAPGIESLRGFKALFE